MRQLKSVLIFVLILLSAKTYSQISFQRTYGFSELNEGQGIVYDFNEGYIICGSTSLNNSDIYIIKIHANGTLEWQRTFGGNRIDNSNSIVRTFDSCYVVAGSSNSFSINGDYDFLLMKIDRDGNQVWQKNFGGIDWDFAYDLKQTSDSGFILSGKTYNGISGNSDGILLKTDRDGNEIWSKIFYSSENDEFSALSLNNNGDIIATGKRLEGREGSSDIIAAKVNFTGDSLWYKSFGNSDAEEASDIDCRNGNCLIVGSIFSNNDTLGLNNLSFRITENGDSISTILLSPPEDEITTSLDFYSDSSIYWITGYTTSNGGGKKDLFISKVDTNGMDIRGTTFGNTEDETGYDIINTNDGGAIAVGSSTSYRPGNRSLFIVKIDSGFHATSVVIKVDEIKNDNLNNFIYPNPADDKINIHADWLQNYETFSFQITDLSGKIVMEDLNYTVSNIKLDRTKIIPGIYIIRIFNDLHAPLSSKILLR